ncbi:16S rRNA (guanine966-N2)-methyltransferase [Methylomarinovum caldicuralii]|uniref:Ribosomal RNA small subunit methyltransferase D n=1 Tax=Methylomarinovum caldicuralii TaxID=438856 RepID=A0AAU9CHB0_9GAMM|nr:16S rRNA (guanine(966)-N(2))-methyltransferase RsmD [Methylomarinovum caldicuralii]BCX82385.1 16S rRNA (guanine966-N2)-methyltransferase [Methylomarinovum caldicuralii]
MAKSSEVRLIAGRWRGRRLRFPAVSGLRPTPGIVRETLFNWLREAVSGARCLDLYAGSGALGLEAASRGAGEVVQVESHPGVVRHLQATARQLNAEIRVVRADVPRFLRRPPDRPFDIVFLDPPFGRGQVAPVCQALEQGGWLTATAWIYVEAEAVLTPAVPSDWTLWRHKRVGEVGCHLYRRQAQA